MGICFKHTILQRAQNFEIMCTEKMKNLNKTTSDQPMQVTDFSISRILSEENKNNKNKNCTKNENIYTKSKTFLSGPTGILDLSIQATPIHLNNGPSAQQLPATAPFTNYGPYTGLGPMDFLVATKFYAQFLPHMLPQNCNLLRSNVNQHFAFPSGSTLPIARNNPTGPIPMSGYAFQTPKTQKVFTPYVLNKNKMDVYMHKSKVNEVISNLSTVPSFPKSPSIKSPCIYNTPMCTKVNCSDCLKEYYQHISLKISSNAKSYQSPEYNTVKLKNQTDTQLKTSAVVIEEPNYTNINFSTTVSDSLTTKLSPVMTISSPEEISYKCFICDKVFGCSQTLQAHEKTHKSPRYECSDCGKGFSQLRNYKYHLSVHRGTKEFAAECPECGKTFNDKGYLSSHMKIHRNKKEYECPYCPKSFNQRVAFNMHVRIHTGVKPHKCTECGKRFSRKMLLKQHMRTHSGEKPYQCSVCGKSFADRSNMTLHHRLHSGIKPFSCPICPKAFTKKHHLKTHLNYHTGCKPYVCPHSNCNQAFTQSSNMRTHAKKCQYRPPLQLHPVVVAATSNSAAAAAATTIIKSNNNYKTTPIVTNALHYGMSSSVLTTKPTTTLTATSIPVIVPNNINNNMRRLSTALPTSMTSILYPVNAVPTLTSATIQQPQTHTLLY